MLPIFKLWALYCETEMIRLVPFRIIVFSLGALMLYYLLYQSKLIPRWISGWGFIAIHIVSSYVTFLICSISSVPFSTIKVVLNLPIGLQEMVMAVWLIVKGFNPSAIASLSAKYATNETFERVIDLHYRGEGGLKTLPLPCQTINRRRRFVYAKNNHKKEKEMNTNKSTTGIDPKVKLSLRKIAVITGVIFIIATVLPILASSLVPDSDWCGLPHSVLYTYEPGGRRSAAHSHRILRMCRHSRRDVSGLEEVGYGSGPWICRLQDY